MDQGDLGGCNNLHNLYIADYPGFVGVLRSVRKYTNNAVIFYKYICQGGNASTLSQ